MHKGVLSSLILSVLMVYFALQNTHQVTISFWPWSFQISLALLVVILFVLGVLLGYVLWLPAVYTKNKLIRDKDAKLRQAETAKVEAQKAAAQQVAAAKTNPTTNIDSNKKL